jgi:hypothetical protein
MKGYPTEEKWLLKKSSRVGIAKIINCASFIGLTVIIDCL